MARTFIPETEGDDGWSDWVHPLDGYKMSCCDCGLVHNMQFRVDDIGQINFRASRNPRSTGQVRRNMMARGEGLLKPSEPWMEKARAILRGMEAGGNGV